MSQAILKFNGRIAPLRTIRHLTVAEMPSESELKKQMSFDEAISKLHGDSMSLLVQPVVPDDEKSDFITVEDGDPIMINHQKPHDYRNR